jgi:hypothetical protein
MPGERIEPKAQAEVRREELGRVQLREDPVLDLGDVESVLPASGLGAQQPDRDDQRVAERPPSRSRVVLHDLVAERPVAELHRRKRLQRESLQLPDARLVVGGDH